MTDRAEATRWRSGPEGARALWAALPLAFSLACGWACRSLRQAPAHTWPAGEPTVLEERQEILRFAERLTLSGLKQRGFPLTDTGYVTAVFWAAGKDLALEEVAEDKDIRFAMLEAFRARGSLHTHPDEGDVAIWSCPGERSPSLVGIITRPEPFEAIALISGALQKVESSTALHTECGVKPASELFWRAASPYE